MFLNLYMVWCFGQAEEEREDTLREDQWQATLRTIASDLESQKDVHIIAHLQYLCRRCHEFVVDGHAWLSPSYVAAQTKGPGACAVVSASASISAAAAKARRSPSSKAASKATSKPTSSTASTPVGGRAASKPLKRAEARRASAMTAVLCDACHEAHMVSGWCIIGCVCVCLCVCLCVCARARERTRTCRHMF